MAAIIQLSAARGARRVTFTIDDAAAQKPAIDFVFDVVGAEDLDALVEAGVVSDADLADLRVVQGLIFDRDDQGAFIRDGVEFLAVGGSIDPDAPLAMALQRVDQGGASYGRCDLTVKSPLDGLVAPPAQAAPVQAAPQASQAEQMKQFALMLFLHRIARGTAIDVTKDHLDLADVIEAAELRTPPLIDIDTKNAVYTLSDAGRRYWQGLMDEAQDLVKRYDIYGDVDLDASGTARFDTGLGADWRVPAFELAGVDPFKARFLLGLNDGEWDHLEGWEAKLADPAWYGEVFAPVEQAPSLEQVGETRLRRAMEQARAVLRQDGVFLD